MIKEEDLYAKKNDLDLLALIVENLSEQFKESKEEERNNFREFTNQLSRFTSQVEALTLNVNKMQEQIGSLVEYNIRRTVFRDLIRDFLKSSPKFISILFSISIFFLLFFTTNAHKDVLKYFSDIAKNEYSLEKAKYGIEDAKRSKSISIQESQIKES
jgi:hypothetical protein